LKNITTLQKLLPRTPPVVAAGDVPAKIKGTAQPEVSQDGADGRFLDMSFLEPLHLIDKNLAKDNFFPNGKMYIRDCMRTIFRLFDERDFGHTVLIGSPGVGKSILCFLAALYKAQKKPVVFYRQTSYAYTSVFIMHPRSNGGADGIDVAFTRKLRNNDLNTRGGLCGLHNFLVRRLGVAKRVEDVLWFVDGPKHSDPFLMQGSNFFCTSDGCPSFKDEDDTSQRWILNGWTKEEAAEALSVQGKDEVTIDKVYHLCGGNIRNMIAACSDYDGVRNKVDGWVNALKIPTITEVGANIIHDRVLTMFRKMDPDPTKNSDELLHAVQYVDSALS
jgi:hypothetical protein